MLLVAEDEFLVALDLQTTLEEHGYQVCGLAATARDAVALAEQHRPNLALVDVNLARGSNGLEAVATLKEQLGIPAIVVTGHGTTKDAKNAGALGCLTKPFHPESLLHLIESVLAWSAGQKVACPAPTGFLKP
jgi:DNA-binding response OmpR family regulator